MPARKHSDLIGHVLITTEVAEDVSELVAMLPPETSRISALLPPHVAETVRALDIPEIEIYDTTWAAIGDRRAKVTGLAKFLLQLRWLRPTVLLSGTSLLKYRVCAKSLRIPHIAYYRSPMFAATTLTGFSDGLANGKYGQAIGRSFLNIYGADQFVTSTSINFGFLGDRGVEPERVTVSGPVWLSEKSVRNVAGSEGVAESRLFYCTGSYGAHGDYKDHAIQTQAIRDLFEELGEMLIIRVHPRDHHNYAADPVLSSVRLDRRSPDSFLSTLTCKDLVLSQPSTMVLEAGFLGVRSAVFYIEEPNHRHRVFDQQELGVKCESLSSIVSEIRSKGSEKVGRVCVGFEQIDLKALQYALARLS